MEFVIGNGHVFLEKDVLQAIQNLDTESQETIAKSIVETLSERVNSTEKFRLSDLTEAEKAKEALESIDRLIFISIKR